MPVYEYYCRECASKFDKLRPMSAANDTAICPTGHTGATRTLSLFATFARGESGELQSFPGGCGCGGACACGGHSQN